MNTKERLELAHWAANTAKRAGADDAAVDISNSRAVETEFRDGKLDRVKESTQNSLNISLYVDSKFSGHSTNDLRRESLERFIKKTVAMTRLLSEDEFRGLPDPKYYQGQKEMDLELIDGGYSGVTADQRVKMARELQGLTESKCDKVVSCTAGYYDDESEVIKVHSNGFEGTRQTTSFSYGVEVTIDDGKGGLPADWCYATTRFLNDMPKAEELAKTAIDRAEAKIGQAKVESGNFDMVVFNRASSNPIYAMYGPMTGRSLHQKRSFLDGLKDTKITSELLTIVDDPFIKRGLGSRTYDGDGMPTRRRALIEKGVLKEFLIDYYYGRKLGVEPTGGSSTNLVFEYGDKSPDDMIKDVTKGIFVTGFIGGNSDSTTGDFSWGLRGMLIENGKLVKPVNEMNISGNLLELWKSLVAVGNDPYQYSSLKRPSLHFKNVQFSGL